MLSHRVKDDAVWDGFTGLEKEQLEREFIQGTVTASRKVLVESEDLIDEILKGEMRWLKFEIDELLKAGYKKCKDGRSLCPPGSTE